MVELRKLSIDYPGGSSPGWTGRLGRLERRVPAVADVSAVFASGAISAIVGPSGCGKSSLVGVMAGLLAPSSGEALIDGEPVRGVRPRTAVIFQDYGLLPWLTVEGNAELPLAVRGAGRAERRRRVLPILRELGLSSFGGFYPSRLSGGMKQRVAIARALASEPDLLLMDEPFSSLDALTREAAQEALLEVRRSRPMTIVVVTHSIEEAAYLAEAVFVMGGRNPGSVEARFDVPENSAGYRFAPGAGDFRSAPRYLELCGAIRSALRGSGPTDDSAAEARE